jgi:hypothetical protein
METVLAGQRTTRRKARPQMIDYSEYLLRINRLMQETHKAAQSGNYQVASDYAAEVARYAISLSALFETKTELEI